MGIFEQLCVYPFVSGFESAVRLPLSGLISTAALRTRIINNSRTVTIGCIFIPIEIVLPINRQNGRATKVLFSASFS